MWVQLIQPSQVEKDNACDRVDASEEQCKAARVRIFFHLFTLDHNY